MNTFVALILVALAWISLFFCGIYLVGFIKALLEDYYVDLPSLVIFIVFAAIVIADMVFLCCH